MFSLTLSELHLEKKIVRNEVKRGERGRLQDTISRAAWNPVVTEYKVGGYPFKIMRANGDKQPTDSTKSGF